MELDYKTLDFLRTNHPAWRLLRSEHAPLVAGFLHRVFIVPNTRVLAASDLAEALEDELFGLRERLGASTFPKPATEYLNDWAGNDKGWLRKFYRQGSDEPQFDLTPSTEKAIAWLVTLTDRAFVGTESRLMTVFDLLKQMTEGSEPDPQARIEELEKRRAEVDAEIARIEAGDIRMLDDTAIKDRFQQCVALARELLTDFREVEHNFRMLDRRVRERVALWEGGKGALIEEIMGERDVIVNSDQGRSFRAFWDFLMSPTRQNEFTELLDRVLSLPSVASLNPDGRIRRMHFDWMEAGDHTQRTVAQLSQQLRRFLDDQAWLENRRIMDILHHIETKSLALRTDPPRGAVMELAATAADIALPMERPLFSPPVKPVFAQGSLETGGDDVDATALFSQVVIDKARLASHVRQLLQNKAQVTLREVCEAQPLRQGLAELVAYLHLSGDTFKSITDESVTDVIVWNSKLPSGEESTKRAELPRVIFVR